MPERIGRYTVRKRIGWGGFGCVYLAHDDHLDRNVAIKIPHQHYATDARRLKSLLDEAQTIASLDHPHIVEAYDGGQTDDGRFFLVSRLVEGEDLGAVIRKERPTYRESAILMAKVADALQYAHRRKIVHRDIKPSNIILDKAGEPHLVDFGLALRSRDVGPEAVIGGTPSFMSPEQARGEGHLVDGRSDIFSLGIVLYVLLAGEPPFAGSTSESILQKITHQDARPPRQLNSDIPREMERICLKALAKRAGERYTAAVDMADDLRAFAASFRTQEPSPDEKRAQSAPRSSTEAKIVPKGLRSFDAMDADFFVTLLPGARDRSGLPESIRFWKARIEETDADRTFRIGILYGPSGCGKSSLVKAGLLPRLGNQVKYVYLECHGLDDEARLHRMVARGLEGCDPDWDLVELLTAIRRGQCAPTGVKLLIVLDQFEQWLNTNGTASKPGLLQALRQCDGERIQCLFLVRDDFWMAITHTMQELEAPIVACENAMAVDLFDLLHAGNVLAEFGRSYGRLPKQGDLSRDQQAFLDQAVDGLARNEKIIPVQLALLAEMMKGKVWSPDELRVFGGTQGVTVAYLEETFSESTAPLRHRFHQRAARRVLRALLPDTGVDMRGFMRSRTELMHISGYQDRPNDFTELMHILDGETRLLTPVDPVAALDNGRADADTPDRDQDTQYYQLTHDHLLQPLHTWLASKQKETARGRAYLLLAERAELWTAKPEPHRLPTEWEYLVIQMRTRRLDWSPSQRKMMKVAAHRFSLRLVALVAFICLLIWFAFELKGSLTAASLMKALESRTSVTLVAGGVHGGLPPEMVPFDKHRRWINPKLREVHQQIDLLSAGEREDRDPLPLNAAIVSYYLNGSHGEVLEEGVLRLDSPELLLAVREAMLADPQAVRRYWQEFENAQNQMSRRLRAAGMLAGSSAEADRDRLSTFSDDIVDLLLEEWGLSSPKDYGGWLRVFEPARATLMSPLVRVYRDSERSLMERSWAADILLSYADSGDASFFAQLAIDATAEQFKEILPSFIRRKAILVPALRTVLKKPWPRDKAQTGNPALRVARGAITLLSLGDLDTVWPLFRHSRNPEVRSHLVNLAQPYGIDPSILADRLRAEPDASARRALLLALGDFDPNQLDLDIRTRVVNDLLEAFANDPDPGIHAATERLGNQWSEQDDLTVLAIPFAAGGPLDRRGWYLTRTGGHTLILLGPTGPFLTGSPEGPEKGGSHEDQFERTIPRTFALATKEVTVRQFLRFRPDHAYAQEYAPEEDCPINKVSWIDAARYCNWLSEQEGIPQEEWCYQISEIPTNGNPDYGVTVPGDYLHRTGYRLPTETEWEYACRAGATTSRYFGETPSLLPYYEWHNNSRYSTPRPISKPVGSLKPNDFGLFDMLGNVAEWCHERPEVNLAEERGSEPTPVPDIEENHFWETGDYVIDRGEKRAVRGGKFSDVPMFLRSAHHTQGHPDNSYHNIGFRIARTLPGEKNAEPVREAP